MNVSTATPYAVSTVPSLTERRAGIRSLVADLLVLTEDDREQHSGRGHSDARRTDPAARRGSLNPPREEREKGDQLQSEHLLTRIGAPREFRQSPRQAFLETRRSRTRRARESGRHRRPDRTIASVGFAQTRCDTPVVHWPGGNIPSPHPGHRGSRARTCATRGRAASAGRALALATGARTGDRRSSPHRR